MNNDPTGLGVVMMIVFILFIFFILFWAIPVIITTMRLYSKAGKPSWFAIIPVYSSVVQAEIGNNPAWMGWSAGSLTIVSNLLMRDSNSPVYGIGWLLSLVSLVFGIILLIGFIKAYRASAGFWVAYLLLPIVAVFIVKNVTYGGSSVAAPMVAGTPTGPVAPTATWQNSQAAGQPLSQPTNNQAAPQQNVSVQQGAPVVDPILAAHGPNISDGPANTDVEAPKDTPPTSPAA